MSCPAPPVSRRFANLTPASVGFGLSLLAAVIYTAANVCLRGVAHVDSSLVSSFKAAPMMIIATVMLAVGRSRGYTWRPSGKEFALLVVTSIVAQLGGNVGLQIAFARIGLALSVALSFGTLIVGGAVIGRVWLGERVSARATLSMAVLIGSIIVLMFAARTARGVLPVELHDTGTIVMGVTVACLCGFAYAFLGASIRRLTNSGTPLPVVLFATSATGVIGLGGYSLAHLGWQSIVELPTPELQKMVMAGLFNSVAFIALSRALQLAPVVEINAVNASQMAMAALAGVMFFDEPASVPLLAGIVLTACGLLLVERPKPVAATAYPPSGEAELELCDAP